MSISLSMIVKNVRHSIAHALNSIVPYVDEVVIVDTGSTDGSIDVIKALVPHAKVYDFTPETHPESFVLDVAGTWEEQIPGDFTCKQMLADFGAARQFGLDRCTTDYVIWIDSDDIVEGGQHIPAILKDMEARGVLAAFANYDYNFDAAGNVNHKLDRERIIRRNGKIRWRYPIHEILETTEGLDYYETINIVHQKHKYFIPLWEPAHRNLKVLLKWFEKATQDDLKKDARMLFYLARDESSIWPERAVEHFRQHCQLSQWDEERSKAHMLVGNAYEIAKDYESAFSEYSQAALETSRIPEPIFATARIFYYRGELQKCIDLTERGFGLYKSERRKFSFMHNPLDCVYKPYIHYSAALLQVGRFEDALNACNAGLLWNPDEPALNFNKKKAEQNLKGTMENSRSFQFPHDDDLDDLAIDIPDDVMSLFAIQFWKRFNERHDYKNAIQFLSNLPEPVKSHPRIQGARKLTMLRLHGHVVPALEVVKFGKPQLPEGKNL